MDCVNHAGVGAAAYCQNCGKPMCTTCMRREPTGQVFCEPCSTAWHSAHSQYAQPFVPGPGRCPSPILAGFLGFIPGVGAMFNGQFLKGFLHVIIFAVLASMTDIYSMFGWLVAAWIFYQVFDAFLTAKAKCEGQPLPDPLGMNELVNWIGHEFRRTQGMPPPPVSGPVPPPQGQYAPPQSSNPYQPGYQPPPYTPPAAGFVSNYPPPPPAGFAPQAPPMPGVPPVPPVAPLHWRRREPVAAIVLIAMGVIFLLGQFSWRAMHFTWPVILIVLGVWLVIRRTRDLPPPPQTYMNPQAGPAQQPRWEETATQQPRSDDDLQGGSR